MNFHSLSINTISTQFQIKNHRTLYPLLLVLILFPLLSFAQLDPLVESLLKQKDQGKLQHQVIQLEKGSETDISALISYYNQQPNRPYRKLDSLQNIAIQKFPFGQIAFNKITGRFFSLKDEAKQDSLLLTTKRDFPNMDYDEINRLIAYSALLAKNFTRTKTYANRLNSLSSVAFIGSSWAKADSVSAEQYVRAYIKEENKNKKDFDYLLGVYGSILFSLGEEDKALEYGRLAIEAKKQMRLPFLTYYSQLLEKKKRYPDLLELLEEPYIQGILTPKLEELLFLSYTKANPLKNAEEYHSSLQKKARAVVKATMLKKMLPGYNAPAFTLKDADGNTVSSKDLKGKVLVIDFWATWCGPCIAAFPAMQLALDSYKNNPDVKFLFIHTKETSATPTEEAKAFLKDKKYNFDLYMDIKDKSGLNQVAKAFEVTGIPAKFVIDKKGKVRFNIVGHMFLKDSVLAEEMKAAIELASLQ